MMTANRQIRIGAGRRTIISRVIAILQPGEMKLSAGLSGPAESVGKLVAELKDVAENCEYISRSHC